MFEEGGFDAPRNEHDRKDMKSRLQFDLTESAKTVSYRILRHELIIRRYLKNAKP
jgi:hypothetical protein